MPGSAFGRIIAATAFMAVLAAAPARAAAPDWLPLRSSAQIGCVKTNCGNYHGYWAIDFGSPAGKPVFAAGGGQVTGRGTYGSCLGDSTEAINSPNARGNWVEIDHGGGVTTRYYHLSAILVDRDQQVSETTQIGTVGNTGASTCTYPHLHYERRVNGVASDPGTLRACHGGTLVGYPGALGYGSWADIPSHSNYVSSNGTGCVAPPPPDADADGIPDSGDRCPHTGGTAWLAGCPGSAFGQIAQGPVAAVWTARQLDVVARTPEGTLMHKWFAAGHGWSTEDMGGTLAGDPVAAWRDQQLDVFARAPGGTLLHKWWDPAGWHTEDLGGRFVGSPAVAFRSGQLDVLARTPDGTLLHKWWVPGAGWNEQDLGPGLAGNPVAVWRGDQLDVFARTPGGSLLHKWWHPSAGWSTEDLGGRFEGTPAVTFRTGQLDVLARTPGGTLLHKWWAPGAGWNEQDLGGTLASSPTAAWRGDQLDVFARTPGGSLLHQWWHPSAGWSTEDLGGRFEGSPTATFAPEQLSVFARTASGTLMHKWWVPGYGWNEQDLGGRMAAAEPDHPPVEPPPAVVSDTTPATEPAPAVGSGSQDAGTRRARRVTRTVRLPRRACVSRRLRVSGRGVRVASARRLRDGRCRIRLRVEASVRGRRTLVAPRGVRRPLRL